MRMSVVKLIGVFAISFFAIRRVFWVIGGGGEEWNVMQSRM